MTSPQRNRKSASEFFQAAFPHSSLLGYSRLRVPSPFPPRLTMSSLPPAQFQPMPTEALGLSIGPVVNNETSSPPLVAVPGVVANAPQPNKQRGSQIRQPTNPSATLPPSSLSQEVHSNPNPPSPSHTASPPSAAPGFLPQPQVQQSPPQMHQPASQLNYAWAQNRVPPPVLSNNNGASQQANGTGPRLSDSWVPPDSDLSPDSLARNKKQPATMEVGEEILQQSPPNRINGDWNGDRRGPAGTLAEAMTQRTSTSPTSQLVNPNRGTNSNIVSNQKNGRPRGPTQTSSSPVMVQALRQQTLQQSPPHSHQQQPYAPPSASSSQIRNTPPTSLQGFIPPRDAVNPPMIPLLGRSQTENPTQTAVSQGVRPLGTPPGQNSYSNGRRETTSPLGPGRGTTITSSPPYHTPMESLAGDTGGRTSYMSAVSEPYSARDSYALPFEYDQDDDEYDIRHHVVQDNRNQQLQDAYLRDKTPSPPPTRTLPNPPAPQPQRPNPVPQVQPQPHPHPQPLQAYASSSQGSGFRQPAPRSFPFQEDPEFDDEVPPQQQQPPQQTQPQQAPARWVSQSRERERLPSPPPAPPSPHPPIPIYSPQSVQAAQPPVLQNRHDDSTPSPPAQPPAPLRVNPSAANQAHEEDLEPAEASSDHFTPKSPTVALPSTLR